MDAPDFPAGPFTLHGAHLESHDRHESIRGITALPAAMRAAVAGLAEDQLNARYRNWSLRQIVTHVADSHLNCYMRCKLALTEDEPTIKPYDEDAWAQLPDSAHGDSSSALDLLDALHRQWIRLLTSITPEQRGRSFHHPDSDSMVTIDEMIAQYAWHGRHHLAQIRWVRKNRLGLESALHSD